MRISDWSSDVCSSDLLAARGACFGEAAGWERASWFLPQDASARGEQPEYRYSWGRQNWFDHAAAEHKAVREGVGLFDLTPFAKFLVEGRDAEAVLTRITANDVAVAPGRTARETRGWGQRCPDG